MSDDGNIRVILSEALERTMIETYTEQSPLAAVLAVERAKDADEFSKLAIVAMLDSGFEPIDDYRKDTNGHVVIGFYRPDTFKQEVDKVGTYGAIYVTASARDLRMNSTTKQLAELVKARVGNAILAYNANKEIYA